MKTTLTAIMIGLSLITGVSRTEAVTLYNGSGLPADQPWLTFTNQIGAIQTSGAGAVNLNTNPTGNAASNPIYAGYSNYNLDGTLKNAAFPTLDRNSGYTLNFTVKLNSEFHDGLNDANRAGFSVIAIGNDKQGIELGFWNNEVWGQNVGFTKGESSVFNTTSALIPYTLTITGNTYTLSASGTPLLTNQPLRDYSAFGAPYNTSNFIFFGDNTTSARANFDLGSVAVVPFEFSPTLGLLILGGCAAVSQLKHQKKNPLV